MNRKYVLLCTLLLLGMLVAAAAADTPTFSLRWWTTDSGGTASADGYRSEAAIGQTESAALTDGAYTLFGGFVAPALHSGQPIYFPLVSRN